MKRFLPLIMLFIIVMGSCDGPGIVKLSSYSKSVILGPHLLDPNKIAWDYYYCAEASFQKGRLKQAKEFIEYAKDYKEDSELNEKFAKLQAAIDKDIAANN
ncbi:MAG: hypothetical protein MJZ60_03570 [Bacteroidaceae bacterium]|nr:hypothetical protein [Bacteroidaceae bacterium]